MIKEHLKKKTNYSSAFHMNHSFIFIFPVFF